MGADAPYTEAERADFWAKVQRGRVDECWPWLLGTNKRGYGILWLRGKPRRAHRVAWEMTHGPILTDAGVLHDCDNPPCCNPYPGHLHPGSHMQNMAEMYARGRRDHRKIGGEKNGGAKLTADQVLAIKARLSAGASHRGLAREYIVSHRAIGRIAHGTHWVDRGGDA